MVNCFRLYNQKDDERLVSAKKSNFLKEINDGVGYYPKKDIFTTEFELIVRLWHKMAMNCLLLKKGSSTTISRQEAVIISAIKKKLKLVWLNDSETYVENLE